MIYAMEIYTYMIIYINQIHLIGLQQVERCPMDEFSLVKHTL